MIDGLFEGIDSNDPNRKYFIHFQMVNDYGTKTKIVDCNISPLCEAENAHKVRFQWDKKTYKIGEGPITWSFRFVAETESGEVTLFRINSKNPDARPFAFLELPFEKQIRIEPVETPFLKSLW